MQSPYKAMREASYSMLQALPWKINLALLDATREWMNGGKGVRFGNFSPATAIWAGTDMFADIDDILWSWYGSQSPFNLGGVKDETLDAMILKGRMLVDEDERLAQYLDIQRYIAAQMYSVAGNPTGLTYTMVSQRVRNYLIPGDVQNLVGGTAPRLWLKR